MFTSTKQAIQIILVLAGLFHHAVLADPVNKRIATADHYTLFVDDNGTLWEWGHQKDIVIRKVLTDVRYVHNQNHLAFAIKKDNTLWGWGNTRYGQLGKESSRKQEKAVRVMKDIQSVISNGDTVFAIRTNHSLYTWGKSTLLGDTGDNHRAEPEQILKLIGEISASPYHVLALSMNGYILTWGSNDCGSLGNGTSNDYDEPERINPKIFGSNRIVHVVAKDNQSYAITADGRLWFWGKDENDQCIMNGKKPRLPQYSSVVQDVQDISVGDRFILILKKDNTVWMWGDMKNNVNSSINPVRMLDNAAEIAAGPRHAIVLKRDGTLWGWGENSHSQLGDDLPGTNKPRQLKIPTRNTNGKIMSGR